MSDRKNVIAVAGWLAICFIIGGCYLISKDSFGGIPLIIAGFVIAICVPNWFKENKER